MTWLSNYVSEVTKKPRDNSRLGLGWCLWKSSTPGREKQKAARCSALAAR